VSFGIGSNHTAIPCPQQGQSSKSRVSLAQNISRLGLELQVWWIFIKTPITKFHLPFFKLHGGFLGGKHALSKQHEGEIYS